MRLKLLGGGSLLTKHSRLKSLRLVVNKQHAPERLEMCMNSKYSWIMKKHEMHGCESVIVPTREAGQFVSHHSQTQITAFVTISDYHLISHGS